MEFISENPQDSEIAAIRSFSHGLSLRVFPRGDIFRHVSLGNAAPTDYLRLRGLWDAPDCFRGIHGGKYLDDAVEH